MASDFEQRKRQGVARPDRDLDGRRAAEAQPLEQLEDGQDIDGEQAQRLQPKLGNQAVAAILSRASGGRAVATKGVEIEADDEMLDIIEEEGPELEVPGHGGAGGGGGGGGDPRGVAGDPWDTGLIFGGDDDDPLPPRRRPGAAGRRPRAPRPGPSMREDAEEIGLLREADVAVVDALVTTTPPLDAARRLGDAVYRAVEPALLDVRAIGRTAWSPEDLVDRTGAADPLGRPALIGRFLADAAEQAHTRSLARLLAGPNATLLPPVGGHAGAVARLASLAVCCEAMEGQGLPTDRAVALALVRDAWPRAIAAAQQAAERRQLHAPEIARMAILAEGLDDSETPGPHHLPAPSRLGGRALSVVVPTGPIPAIPSLNRRPAPTAPAPDDLLASIDAMMAQLMEVSEPDAPDAEATSDRRARHAILRSAEALVNAMGRAQVELAAAALAVRRVRPDAPIRQILVHGDLALRALARDVIAIGESLGRAEVEPQVPLRVLLEPCVAALRRASSSLVELRAWAYEALAGAMDA